MGGRPRRFGGADRVGWLGARTGPTVTVNMLRAPPFVAVDGAMVAGGMMALLWRLSLFSVVDVVYPFSAAALRACMAASLISLIEGLAGPATVLLDAVSVVGAWASDWVTWLCRPSSCSVVNVVVEVSVAALRARMAASFISLIEGFAGPETVLLDVRCVV